MWLWWNSVFCVYFWRREMAWWWSVRLLWRPVRLLRRWRPVWWAAWAKSKRLFDLFEEWEAILAAVINNLMVMMIVCLNLLMWMGCWWWPIFNLHFWRTVLQNRDACLKWEYFFRISFAGHHLSYWIITKKVPWMLNIRFAWLQSLITNAKCLGDYIKCKANIPYSFDGCGGLSGGGGGYFATGGAP